MLTHDALGIGPLFYARSGDRTTFATDLLDLPAGDALDDDYFADYLATGYIRTARTPYRGVSRLLPGETLVLTPAAARPRRTWNLADVVPLRYRDPADYQHHLRELLRDGVTAALGTTGTTWIALSGGLDSSTVAVLAAAAPGARVGAYSLVAPGHAEADESRWMASVVRHTGMRWHAVDVETILPFSRLPDRPTGEPTTAVIGTAQIAELRRAAAANGVSTLLTGNGGDAVLGARSGPIPTHLADPLFRGQPVTALRDLDRWRRAATDRRPWTYWASRALVRPTLAHLRGRLPLDDRRTPFPDWLAADYVRRADLGGRDGRPLAPRCRTPGEQAVWDTLWQGSLSLSLAGTQGYDFRHPLLHRPLVEFMQAIPWAEKLRPRCDRLLQRRALKGILPDDVRRRSTKALGSWPFVAGLARSAAWQEYLGDDPCVADRGFTTRAAWRQAIAQAASGHTGGDRFFLTMVAIECWLRNRRPAK